MNDIYKDNYNNILPSKNNAFILSATLNALAFKAQWNLIGCFFFFKKNSCKSDFAPGWMCIMKEK